VSKNKVRSVIAIGIGTALFILISYVNIPVIFISDISFQPRVALLACISALFGPIVGGAVGLFGHAFSDLLLYGELWWSWILPEAVTGLIIGFFSPAFKIKEGGFNAKCVVFFNLIQIIANALAWILIAPVLDILIYKAPSDMTFSQGSIAFVANILSIGIISSIILLACSLMKLKMCGIIKKK
jgi:energy-coupling factor transport system substrate-specific component